MKDQSLEEWQKMVEDAINSMNERLKHVHYELLCLEYRVGKLDGE